MIRTLTLFVSALAFAMSLAVMPVSAGHLGPQVAAIEKDIKAIWDWCNENETDNAKIKKCLDDEGYDELQKELEELKKKLSSTGVDHDDPDNEKRLKKLAADAKKKAKGK